MKVASEHRSLLLGATLGVLATLLVAAGVLGSSDARDVAPAPAPRTTPPTTTATTQTRTFFHGRLVAIDAKTITIEQSDGVHVLPIQSDTDFCRTSCRDVWEDLRVGDDVEAGVTQIGTVVLTQWVGANATGGWVVVDAVDTVDGNRLTVRWGKPAASQDPFTVTIGPNTRWNTESRGPQPVCPGEQVHLVGGEQEPGLVAAWTISPGRASAACPITY